MFKVNLLLYSVIVLSKKNSTGYGLELGVLEMAVKLCVKSGQFIPLKSCLQYSWCVHTGPQIYMVQQALGVLVRLGAIPNLY